MALKPLYSGRDAMETHLLRDLLEERGISAVVLGDYLINASGALPLGTSAFPRVWVHQDDLLRARAVVAEFEQRSASSQPATDSAPAPAPWVCPKCRETVEGQFTDCWSCQTPRPGTCTVPEPVDAASADLTLDVDVVCIRCQYNLRGLTPRHRCPECGLPILRSLLDLLRDGLPPDAHELGRRAYLPFESAASSIGHPASALILVCHAWLHALEPPDSSGQTDQADELSPADRVKRSLWECAIDYFGTRDDAQAGLWRWGIRGSQDLGQVVCDLMTAGLIDRSEQDLAEALKNGINREYLPPEPRPTNADD